MASQGASIRVEHVCPEPASGWSIQSSVFEIALNVLCVIQFPPCPSLSLLEYVAALCPGLWTTLEALRASSETGIEL